MKDESMKNPILVDRDHYFAVAQMMVMYGDALNSIIRVASEAEERGEQSVTYSMAELYRLVDPAFEATVVHFDVIHGAAASINEQLLN